MVKKKEVFLMLVAEAIGGLAIRLTAILDDCIACIQKCARCVEAPAREASTLQQCPLYLAGQCLQRWQYHTELFDLFWSKTPI
jgi:hypothetical protein